MASCKDCIHYEVCKNHYNICQADNLNLYKDRTRFVELPTVGYLISIPVRIGAYVYFIKSASSYLKELKQEMVRKIEIYCGETIMRTENRSFGVEKIGKTVFLIKEAAEKALEEQESNESNR